MSRNCTPNHAIPRGALEANSFDELQGVRGVQCREPDARIEEGHLQEGSRRHRRLALGGRGQHAQPTLTHEDLRQLLVDDLLADILGPVVAGTALARASVEGVPLLRTLGGDGAAAVSAEEQAGKGGLPYLEDTACSPVLDSLDFLINLLGDSGICFPSFSLPTQRMFPV